MKDQRQLFKEVYEKFFMNKDAPIRKLTKELKLLMCEEKLVLYDYEEVNHKKYGHSLFLTVYLNAMYCGSRISLVGNLNLPLQEIETVAPRLFLKDTKYLHYFDYSIINRNHEVNIPYSWQENPSIYTYISEVINSLENISVVQKEQTAILTHQEKQATTSIQELSLTNMLNDLNGTNQPTSRKLKTPGNVPYIPYNTLGKRSQLGFGAFGTVFEADWNGQVVAIKEFNEHVTPKNQEYLNREIEIQNSLEHPNRIELYGISETQDSRPVIVMELADMSLADMILKRDGLNKIRRTPIPKLTNKQKHQIILEIADFFVYFHNKGYIHRDIKIENILVKNGQAKVSDFGLAREMYKSSMKVTVVGTRLYAAPEQLEGDEITNVVDCYSFGCMIAEILYEKEWCQLCNKKRIEKLPLTFITDNTPEEVKSLLEDCFLPKEQRPSMKQLYERISKWNTENWKL